MVVCHSALDAESRVLLLDSRLRGNDRNKCINDIIKNPALKRDSRYAKTGQSEIRLGGF
jgi:hypothetical protein